MAPGRKVNVKLCEACKINFGALVESDVSNRESLKHHAVLYELLAAVKNGCSLCSLLWKEVLVNSSKTPREVLECVAIYDKKYSPLVTFRSAYYRSFGAQGAGSFGIAILTNDDFNHALGCTYCPIVSRRFLESQEMMGVREHTTAFTKIMSSGTADWSTTGSSGPLALAKQWIQECSGHSECSGNLLPSWVPTRLIEIEPAEIKGTFKLVLTEGRCFKEPYCSLSHRWNDTTSLQRLTTKNIQAFQEGVSSDALPSTFREAFTVCKKLGVRFIWIDSLTILQDDINDWQQQSQQMSLVYTNAYCNIAADAGTNISGGLFAGRNPSSLLDLTYELPSENMYIYEGEYHLMDGTQFSHGLDCQPLNQRAWVFQERLLAQRILHFTARELLWECKTKCASEVHPAGIPSSVLDSPLKDLKSFLQEEGRVCRDGKKVCKICRKWHDLVASFTNSKLTFPDDRPLAMAGLADHFGKLINDKYVAGMWQDHLHRQLAWYVAQDRPYEGIPPRRRKFPTFSWLSIDGTVLWFFPRIDIIACVPLFEILSVHIGAVETTPEGLLQKGELRLVGLLIATPQYSKNRQYLGTIETEPSEEAELSRGSSFGSHTVYVDKVAAYSSRNVPVPGTHLMPLIAHYNEIACIILEAANERKKIFRRVGIVFLNEKRDKLMLHKWGLRTGGHGDVYGRIISVDPAAPRKTITLI